MTVTQDLFVSYPCVSSSLQPARVPKTAKRLVVFVTHCASGVLSVWATTIVNLALFVRLVRVLWLSAKRERLDVPRIMLKHASRMEAVGAALFHASLQNIVRRELANPRLVHRALVAAKMEKSKNASTVEKSGAKAQLARPMSIVVKVIVSREFASLTPNGVQEMQWKPASQMVRDTPRRTVSPLSTANQGESAPNGRANRIVRGATATTLSPVSLMVQDGLHRAHPATLESLVNKVHVENRSAPPMRSSVPMPRTNVSVTRKGSTGQPRPVAATNIVTKASVSLALALKAKVKPVTVGHLEHRAKGNARQVRKPVRTEPGQRATVKWSLAPKCATERMTIVTAKVMKVCRVLLRASSSIQIRSTLVVRSRAALFVLLASH